MNLSNEERQIGKENFQEVTALTRREFLTTTVATGLAAGSTIGAAYFGYQSIQGNPLRVGIIGSGDEGNVLIGALNPDYIQVVALADIRPYNVHRAFHGDVSSPSANTARPGLMKVYKWGSEEEARKQVKLYTDRYEDLLDDPAVEAVIIALPLHLHAPAAAKALRKGKHVLTEKLMGKTVGRCKEMARISREQNLFLVTGHQRHYSILYANAVDSIRRGLIGDIHHIRALWHRGNLPGNDSWQQPLPDSLKADLDKISADIAALASSSVKEEIKKREKLEKKLSELQSLFVKEQRQLDLGVDAAKYGYKNYKLEGGYEVTPMEELIRWRLFNRTGGGLMAELGSHQLDAAGIFIAAAQVDGKKALPLTVSAVGGRHIFPADREVDDHVYCMYEFPAAEYKSDPNKKIVVTYSSINGNGFGGYGETVLGTKGTLLLEREQEVLIYKNSATTTRVTVKAADGAAPVLDTTASGNAVAVAAGNDALYKDGPPSRGYREEIEHWAWCIRNSQANNTDEKALPRCRPEIALGDAVIALTTNIAITKKQPITFEEGWFKVEDDANPEGDAIDLMREEYKV